MEGLIYPINPVICFRGGRWEIHVETMTKNLTQNLWSTTTKHLFTIYEKEDSLVSQKAIQKLVHQILGGSANGDDYDNGDRGGRGRSARVCGTPPRTPSAPMGGWT